MVEQCNKHLTIKERREMGMKGNNVNLVKSIIMGDEDLISLVIDGSIEEAIEKAQEKAGVVLSSTQKTILESNLQKDKE